MTGFNSKRDSAADKLPQPPLPVQPVQEPVEEWPGQSNIESQHNACQHRGYCKQLKAQQPLPAQPAQEPFGWYSAREDEFMTDKIRKEHERLNSYIPINGKFDLALYTAPPLPVQEPYDQTALELCNVCGWKTLIPDDGCLNCEREQPAQEPVAWTPGPNLFKDWKTTPTV